MQAELDARDFAELKAYVDACRLPEDEIILQLARLSWIVSSALGGGARGFEDFLPEHWRAPVQQSDEDMMAVVRRFVEG